MNLYQFTFYLAFTDKILKSFLQEKELVKVFVCIMITYFIELIMFRRSSRIYYEEIKEVNETKFSVT